MTQATETTTGCTADQRAEWAALHDKLSEIRQRQDAAEGMAVHYLQAHLDAGAMTPGKFGIPSREALTEYERACEALTEARADGETAREVRAELDAHPYTLELNARREVRP